MNSRRRIDHPSSRFIRQPSPAEDALERAGIAGLAIK
jgi:hypothetical protein